ncbi:hypothetical protein D3C87_1553960 [compost metagenome]
MPQPAQRLGQFAQMRHGLARELLDLVGKTLDGIGDDGKAPSRIAGPCRLDRGVEGQKLGFAGDLGDGHAGLLHAPDGVGHRIEP